MLFMHVDATILKRISANYKNQHIKRMVCCDNWGLAGEHKLIRYSEIDPCNSPHYQNLKKNKTNLRDHMNKCRNSI